jgi:hypothetical protein
MDLKSRLLHLPSTLLGLVAAGTTAAGSALGCQLPLTSWKVWGPAVLLATWGGLIQGPAKPPAGG